MPKRARVAVRPAKPASTPPPPAKERPRLRLAPPPAPARLKIVWEVVNGSGKVIKTYPYPEKAAAEAATRQLTHSSRRAHVVRAAKVPME